MPLTACLVLLIFTIAAHSQTLVFGPNELAVGDSLSNNQRPRLAYDDAGVLHLVWAAGPDVSGGIYHQMAPNGTTFGAPRLISGAVQGFFVDLASGPTIRCKAGYVVAGWEDHDLSNRGIWAVRSTDGGISWQTPVRADTRLPLLRYYQSIGVFPDGRMSQMWMTHDETEHNPTYEWAIQTGDTTFSTPVDAADAATHEVCDCCPPDQLVLDDGQTVLTAFRNNIDNLREIHITRSTDGGVSFPQDFRVDTSNWIQTGCPVTGPHMAYEGNTVIATWMAWASQAWHIYTARSVDGGATWHPMVEAAAASAGPPRNYPQVAIRGHLVVVAWEGIGEQFSTRIFAAASTDTGATFGDAVAISDSGVYGPTAATVAISPDYTVDVAWKDYRSGAARIFRSRGTVSLTGSDEGFSPLPDAIGLSVYPNPFNAVVRLDYELSSAVPVTLAVFDLTGREVTTLTSGMRTAGRHSVLWNAADLPSGIYLARMQAGDVTQVQKLMLLK